MRLEEKSSLISASDSQVAEVIEQSKMASAEKTQQEAETSDISEVVHSQENFKSISMRSELVANFAPTNADRMDDSTNNTVVEYMENEHLFMYRRFIAQLCRMRNFTSKLFRPKVQEGFQRIDWTCVSIQPLQL